MNNSNMAYTQTTNPNVTTMTEEEQPFDDELNINVKLARLTSHGSEVNGTLEKLKTKGSRSKVVQLDLATATDETEMRETEQGSQCFEDPAQMQRQEMKRREAVFFECIQ